MNINDRFHDAIDWLYTQNGYLAAQVSYLGYPVVSETWPPTACVMWDDDSQKIKFMFNKSFCESLSDREFCFVVAHEAMHIINGHIFVLKRMIDKYKKRKGKSELVEYKEKFAIASDCVVNDSLVNLYGLSKDDISEGFEIYWGENIIGNSTEHLSVDDVIKLIPNNKTSNAPNHDLWDTFFEDNGSLKKDFVDAISDLVNKKCQGSMSDEDYETVEELKDSMTNCTDRYAKKAGKSLGSNLMKVDNLSASLAWERILFTKVPRGKLEDVWSRPARRMINIWPEVILPDSKQKDVEEIFVAVDVSGSIDKSVLNLFLSVVKNTPKNFKINAITFNTRCEAWDIHSNQVNAGGGTRFDIIENYIQDECKKYPKAIFVLTDGLGNRVSPEFPERWVWLLYGACHTEHIKAMDHYKLKELIR